MLRIATLLFLTAVVASENTAKAVVEKNQDKRATSYTQVVHGSTGLDPIPGRSGYGDYYAGHGAVQLAYIPVANYHGYGDIKTIALTKDIPISVPHSYPVAVEKRIPYPVNIAVAVPFHRPVPVHVVKPYPVAIEKPVPYSVGIPVKVPIAYAVPKPYAVPTPVPEPVYVKSGNSYDNNGEYSAEDSGYNKGYSNDGGDYYGGTRYNGEH